MTLVLSLFSGLGALDEGFREAGWCVVSAGDVTWSSLYDVRRFVPPPGVFDGIIGGDPCQSHSNLASFVRAKGLEPSFPDLTGEFQRIVEEARPRWFLRENVPGAPDCKPAGYDVRSFLLDHSTLDRGDGIGHEQMRRRRFWFGVDQDPYASRWVRCRCCDEFWCRFHWQHASECPCLSVDEPCPELRAHLSFAFEVVPEPALCVDAGHDKLDYRPGDAVRYSLDRMLDLQGLPPDLLGHSPLTMQGKRKLVANAVPLPMARALARAVRKVMV